MWRIFLLLIPLVVNASTITTTTLFVGPTSTPTPTPSMKPDATGIYDLVTATNGQFWNYMTSVPSYVSGVRGRVGMGNVEPYTEGVYDFSGITAALDQMGVGSQKVSLNIACGTSGSFPVWMRSDPTISKIKVDLADISDDEFYDGQTYGTTKFTSQSALFVSTDVGLGIKATGITPGTTIAAVVSSTEVTLSQAATGSASNLALQIVNRGTYQPVYWDPDYMAKYHTFIIKLGQLYDGDSRVPYMVISGFMPGAEMFTSNTPTDDVKWTQAALDFGYTNKADAMYYAASTIMNWWLDAFPSTPLVLTFTRVWSQNDSDNNSTQSQIQAYLDTTRIGTMTTGQHAKLGPFSPPVSLHTEPYGSQEISAANDHTRYYQPAIPDRVYNDANITSGSTTVTFSSDHGFTTVRDVGHTITGAGIKNNTTIAAVTNTTTIVLSQGANKTQTTTATVVDQPGYPTALDDMIHATWQAGRKYLELWPQDAETSINESVLESGIALLQSNVP